MRRDYHFPETDATFTVLSDRDHEGPHGLFGGGLGRKAHYLLNPNGGESEPEELTSKCVIDVRAGDTVSFQTPGGGGYGKPEARDPELVLDDVINGKITAERARDVYKVALGNGDSSVDVDATGELRESV